MGWVRKLLRHWIATLWVLACVLLLFRMILLRHASGRAFGDAEEVFGALMFSLSFPSSLLIYWKVASFPPSGWPYPGHDARTILGFWLYLFGLGLLQWFVIVPWVFGKMFDTLEPVWSKVKLRLRGTATP